MSVSNKVLFQWRKFLKLPPDQSALVYCQSQKYLVGAGFIYQPDICFQQFCNCLYFSFVYVLFIPLKSAVYLASPQCLVHDPMPAQSLHPGDV